MSELLRIGQVGGHLLWVDTEYVQRKVILLQVNKLEEVYSYEGDHDLVESQGNHLQCHI